MAESLNEAVIKLQHSKDSEGINGLIQSYQPFILHAIVEIKKSYVDINNDDEYSIGLMAFHEAIMNYDKDRGEFLTYAKLVIISRVKDYWKQNTREVVLSEGIEEATTDGFEAQVLLQQEIHQFKEVLASFGLTIGTLADTSPKHQTTRERAKDIGWKAGHETDFVAHLYSKRRLPITGIAKRFHQSVKIIKRSKSLITAVMIIVKEEFEQLYQWIGH